MKKMTVVAACLVGMWVGSGVASAASAASEPVAAAKQADTIKATLDVPLMKELAAVNPSLGIFWYRLAASSVVFDSSAGKGKKEVSFRTHTAEEAEQVFLGKAKINSLPPDDIATFTEYSYLFNDKHQVVVSFAMQDKVKAGPNIKIKYDQFYELTLERNAADGTGRIVSVKKVG